MELQLNHGSNAVSARPQHTMKVAYTISERQGRSFWTRVGVGFINRDGSINIRLEALPISGALQLRDWAPRDSGPPEPEPAQDALKVSGTDIPF